MSINQKSIFNVFSKGAKKGKRKTKKASKAKPKWRWHTVGRSTNLKRAKVIAKSYPKKHYETKIVKQKSGYAVKIKAPRG